MNPINVRKPNKENMTMVFELAMSAARISTTVQMIGEIAAFFELAWMAEAEGGEDGKENSDASKGNPD